MFCSWISSALISSGRFAIAGSLPLIQLAEPAERPAACLGESARVTLAIRRDRRDDEPVARSPVKRPPCAVAASRPQLAQARCAACITRVRRWQVWAEGPEFPHRVVDCLLLRAGQLAQLTGRSE